MFTFIHTGDLHLDSPFVGLSDKVPASIAETLRTSTLQAWRAVVDLALEERVDFLVVAGDAFERANRTLKGMLEFRNELRRLADAGIPSYLVTGNHDHEQGRIPQIEWPELVHRLSAKKVDQRSVVRAGEEIARIYGQGYEVQFVKRNIAATMRKEADAPFAIGLLHTNVDSDPSAGDYAPCSMTDLRASGMDYWALGHIHRHRVLQEERPTVVYCGNPQGRDPGETEPRGCYLVRVDGTVATPEFRVVDVVRWRTITLPIGDVATEEGLVRLVSEALDAERAEAGRSVVVRVTLTGSGPGHEILRSATRLAEIRDAVRTEMGEQAPFAWLESLRDTTKPAFDRESRRRVDDLLGGVLALSDATQAAVAATDGSTVPAGALDTVATLNELWDRAGARKLLEQQPLTREELLELLAAAEAMIVDAIAE